MGIFKTLLILSLIGLYSQFHIYSNNQILFPFAVPNLIGITVFGFLALRRQFVGLGTNIILMCLFVFLYMMFAAAGEHFDRSAQRFAQLVLSLYAGYGLGFVILQIPREQLQKILSVLALGILVVAFCEVHLGLYEVMFEINSALYSWRPQGFYTSVLRDTVYWGGVRPLVFSTEPSLVGIWGITLMIGATILKRPEDRMRDFQLLAYAVLLLLVVRTPTIIIILASYFFALLIVERRWAWNFPLIAAGIALAGIFFVIFGLSDVATDYIRGTSVFARIFAPFLTTVEVLQAEPLFGLGLGDDVAVSKTVYLVWEYNSMLSASRTFVETWGITGMITSNFFWNWIYFGLLGGCLFYAIAFHLFQQIGRLSMIMLLLPSAGVWITIGGFVDLRSWFFIYFFAGCLGVAAQRRDIEK